MALTVDAPLLLVVKAASNLTPIFIMAAIGLSDFSISSGDGDGGSSQV